jgi:uncharacterized membrane protein
VAAGLPAAAADSAVEVEVSAVVDQAEVGDVAVRTKEFLSKVDHDRIVQAIRKAESRTSGQIRIYLQRGKLKGDPLLSAQKRFSQLGMHDTKDRNAVLIYVVPRAHKFAVIGDKAVHEKCGDTLWQSVASKMADHFKAERFTDAIVDAIQDLGAVLSEHFPHHAGGQNELPDEIIEG